MDVKNLTIAFTIAGYCIFAALIISIPFKIKKLKSECGELKMALRSDFPLRSILTFAVCALLLGVIPFRNFQLYLSVVFILTALLGSSIASKQVVNSGINGIYENMIISDTTAIKYENILSLPTLSYENQKETTNVDFRLLEILTKNGAKITMFFPNEQTRNQALNVILEQCPRLKTEE